METNFESNKEQIVKKLNEKIPDIRCPFCTNKNFVLVGGYFAHDLQIDLKNRQIGGVNVPTVPLVCKDCGFIAEFAIGTLGLLPKENDKQNESKPSNS